MNDENLFKEPLYIYLIRQKLEIIKNVLFQAAEFSKKQIDSSSKANLLNAMDYLEKEKDRLPVLIGKKLTLCLEK